MNPNVLTDLCAEVLSRMSCSVPIACHTLYPSCKSFVEPSTPYITQCSFLPKLSVIADTLADQAWTALGRAGSEGAKVLHVHHSAACD